MSQSHGPKPRPPKGPETIPSQNVQCDYCGVRLGEHVAAHQFVVKLDEPVR